MPTPVQRLIWVWVVAAVPLLASCDNRPDTYLEACESSLDCMEGLECVERFVGEESGKQCTVSCTTEKDCPTHPCLLSVIHDGCDDDGFCSEIGCE